MNASTSRLLCLALALVIGAADLSPCEAGNQPIAEITVRPAERPGIKTPPIKQAPLRTAPLNGKQQDGAFAVPVAPEAPPASPQIFSRRRASLGGMVTAPTTAGPSEARTDFSATSANHTEFARPDLSATSRPMPERVDTAPPVVEIVPAAVPVAAEAPYESPISTAPQETNIAAQAAAPEPLTSTATAPVEGIIELTPPAVELTSEPAALPPQALGVAAPQAQATASQTAINQTAEFVAPQASEATGGALPIPTATAPADTEGTRINFVNLQQQLPPAGAAPIGTPPGNDPFAPDQDVPQADVPGPDGPLPPPGGAAPAGPAPMPAPQIVTPPTTTPAPQIDAPPEVMPPPPAEQPPAERPITSPPTQFQDALTPAPTGTTIDGLPVEIIDHSREMDVTLRRSKLLRTPVDIYRTAVVDPRVCNVVQFTPREVSIIGVAQGATHVTFWFEDGNRKPVTYLVRVVPDPEVSQRREKQYQMFEDIINELFPDSKIRLIPVSDKLLVRGEAKDTEEAAQIMSIIRENWGYGRAGAGGFGAGGFGYGGFAGGLVEGVAADPLVGQEEAARISGTQVINMLRIPGVQQVALKVKIAELDRSAARRFGVDLDMRFADSNVILQSMIAAASGGAANVIGSFDARQINFGVHFLQQEGVIRLLSEPTLVTMSGRPASFVAGGEFAVPTTVGVAGAAAVTTDFRSFGAIITFLPIVIDKDRIRLQVSPEFSKINGDLKVNNIPGLNTRAVTTTVEMREGQTLAIAGLLEDNMTGKLSGNVPFLWRLFGLRTLERTESELIILVTPELVHAMEPEEVPPLPGFDVTEPNDFQFFAKGWLEGRPTEEFRSTVWPRLKQRYRADGPAMISGPFGHGQ